MGFNQWESPTKLDILLSVSSMTSTNGDKSFSRLEIVFLKIKFSLRNQRWSIRSSLIVSWWGKLRECKFLNPSCQELIKHVRKFKSISSFLGHRLNNNAIHMSKKFVILLNPGKSLCEKTLIQIGKFTSVVKSIISMFNFFSIFIHKQLF